jgi:hypothetical protein
MNTVAFGVFVILAITLVGMTIGYRTTMFAVSGMTNGAVYGFLAVVLFISLAGGCVMAMIIQRQGL